MVQPRRHEQDIRRRPVEARVQDRGGDRGDVEVHLPQREQLTGRHRRGHPHPAQLGPAGLPRPLEDDVVRPGRLCRLRPRRTRHERAAVGGLSHRNALPEEVVEGGDLVRVGQAQAQVAAEGDASDGGGRGDRSQGEGAQVSGGHRGDLRAPQLPQAPARDVVHHRDLVTDVPAVREQDVRHSALGLAQVHDVGALGVGVSAELEGAGGPGDADVVGDQVVHEAGGGSGAARDDVGAGEGRRVDVLRADAGHSGHRLGRHRHLCRAGGSAAERLDLVGDERGAAPLDEVEGGAQGGARDVGVDRRAAAQLALRQGVVGGVVHAQRDLDRVRGDRAVVGGVLRGEDRWPVVPALLLVAEGDLGGLHAVLLRGVAEAVDGGFHAEGVGVAVLQEQVVLVVLAVRGSGGLDEGAVDVPVQVEHDRGLLVEHDLPHRVGLGLRGSHEVPVQVEAVGVGAGARDPAVRVGGDVEVEAGAGEEVPGARVLGGREPLDQLQGGVGALPLVAVDVVVEEDGGLVTRLDLPGLGGCRGRVLDELAHPLLGAGSAGGLRGGDGDEIEPVPARRAARDLHAHPVPEALEVVQLRGDGVVRGQAQLQGFVGGVLGVGGEDLFAGVAADLAFGGGVRGEGPLCRALGGAGGPVVGGGGFPGGRGTVGDGAVRGEEQGSDGH